MSYPILFLTELIALFFISRVMTRRISSLVYHTTRNQKATIYFMAFLFFPGTVIHELSHLIMAGILLVPVGHVELWPKLEGDHVKLGSVMVGDTDVFRRFFIGAAPLFFGSMMLLGLLFFAAQYNLFGNYLYVLLLSYVAFEVGNTMFSSPKDMEGALELLGAVVLLGIIFYFLGVRVPAASLTGFFANPVVAQIFQRGSLFLFIPLGLDFFILLVLKIFYPRRI